MTSSNTVQFGSSRDNNRSRVILDTQLEAAEIDLNPQRRHDSNHHALLQDIDNSGSKKEHRGDGKRSVLPCLPLSTKKKMKV